MSVIDSEDSMDSGCVRLMSDEGCSHNPAHPEHDEPSSPSPSSDSISVETIPPTHDLTFYSAHGLPDSNSASSSSLSPPALPSKPNLGTQHIPQQPHPHHLHHFQRSTPSTTQSPMMISASLSALDLVTTTMSTAEPQHSDDHHLKHPSSSLPLDPPRRSGFSARNKASLCISTHSSLPHTRLEIDQSTPLSAQQHFIHSPRPLLPLSLSDSQSAFISPPPTGSSTTTAYHSLPSGLRPNELPQLSSSSSSSSSEEGPSALLVPSHQPSESLSQLLPVLDGLSPPSIRSTHQPHSVHTRHPSNSTSSVGPNVAGRIGVGGNVMVDPHNSSNLSQKGTVGAGAFVYKVYNMLLDPSFQHLISFNPNGQSFTVRNVQEFSKVVLPKHFKHNNFSSFVRQLNMYGFHKVNKTPRGQRGNDNTASWEFVHPKFHRGRPDLLEQIRRKPLESETNQVARKDGSPMNLTNLFIQPQPSPTGSFIQDSNAFMPIAGHSALHPPHSHSHAPLPPPPHPLSPVKGFGTPGSIPPSSGFPYSHLMPHLAQAQEKQPKIPEAGLAPTAFSASDPQSNLATQIYPHKVSIPSNQAYHSLPSHPSQRGPMGPSDPFPPQFESNMSFMGPIHPHGHPMITDGIVIDQSGQMPGSDSLENGLANLRNEFVGRFHGVSEGHEALYRELYEARKRQDVLIDLCGRMYRSLEILTNGNVGFPFPSQELFSRPVEDSHPTFRITEPDPTRHSEVHQHYHPGSNHSLSVDHSPAVSEFPDHSTSATSRRPLSLDPTGFVGLTLNSPAYPTSPLSPFSAAVKTPLPPSPDYQRALKSLMDGESQPTDNAGLIIGPNGLLGVGGGGMDSKDSLSDLMSHSLSNASYQSNGSGQVQVHHHKGKKRPASGSMDLSNPPPPANSSSRRS